MAGEFPSLSPAELAQRRNTLLHEFSRIDEEFDRRRQEHRLLARGDGLVWERAGDIHPTQQEGHRLARIISPELGFDIHTFRVFQREIAAGGVEGAFHTHGDAVKYYLRGKGKEIIGEDEYGVKAGDLAFIPANVWHGTENTADEPMVFIAFHQIPGTFLPVPAPWQYDTSDMPQQETLAGFLARVRQEDPKTLKSATLYSWRQHFLHELGVLEDEFNRRRQEKRYVVRGEDVPWEEAAPGQELALVAPELGFNVHTLQVSLRVVPAGWKDTVRHRHGEAVHYYVAGQGRETVGDETLNAKEGDLAFIPAGLAHATSNTGRGPLRMLIAEQLPGTYLQVPTIWQDPSLEPGR